MWHEEDNIASMVQEPTGWNTDEPDYEESEEGSHAQGSSPISSTRIENPEKETITQSMQNMSYSMSKTMEKSAQAMTVASIRIDPCVPDAGGSFISHYNFSRWKDVIVATVETIPGLTEQEMFNVFKRTAGPHLIDLLESLSLEDTITSSSRPFTHALEKLNNHFNSDQQIFLAKMNFRTTRQGVKEQSLDYLNRMLKLVKFCGFSREEQEKELVLNIAANTGDPDVRKQALKKGCTFQDLRECILSLEVHKDIEKRNENQFKPNVEVNAVGSNSDNPRPSTWSRRPLSHSSYQPKRFTRTGVGSCSRCGRSDHSATNCPNRDKTCNACGRQGHFAIKCRSKVAKRRGSPPSGYNQRMTKSAKIHEVSSEDQLTNDSNKVGEEDLPSHPFIENL